MYREKIFESLDLGFLSDGFYGVFTNLEDGVSEIIKVNHRRWEIEECFRITKSEFKAHPVYLSKDDRIETHFTTCFISLIIYRLLEKRLNEEFTCHEIISGLEIWNSLMLKAKAMFQLTLELILLKRYMKLLAFARTIRLLHQS